MENIESRQSNSPTVWYKVDQVTNKEGFKEGACMERCHNWPSLPAKHEAKASPNESNDARPSGNLPVSIAAASRCFPPAHNTFHRGSYVSEKSTELPGSPNVFPETENLTHATAFASGEPAPSLLQRPQTGTSPRRGLEASSCTSPTQLSGSISYAHPDIRQRPGSSDLKRGYTLKEALGLLPDDSQENGNRFILDSMTGRIIPPRERALQGNVPAGTETFEDEIGDYANRFYSQKLSQNTAQNKHHLQGENESRRSSRNCFSRLAIPLLQFHSKPSKRSVKPQEEAKSVGMSPTFDPKQFAGNIAVPQNLETSNSFRQWPLALSQMVRQGEDEHLSSCSSVKRLSITDSFGPSLAKSIEEAIRNPNSPSATKPLSSRTDSFEPFLRGPTSPLPTWPTVKTVRFHEPGSRPFPSALPSIYAYHPWEAPRSPPPRPGDPSPDPSLDQCSEKDLSLRGGCLPFSRTRSSRPPRHINSTRRPGNDVPVPRGLWYFAGGRPILKDQPGHLCQHGQSKPKRRSKNRPVLGEVNLSHQRVPHAEPCEPLTFGHLRTWKQQSRPSDCLEPITGRMQSVPRPFWQEFAYSASRGKVRSGRPRRGQGYDAGYFEPEQGMADDRGLDDAAGYPMDDGQGTDGAGDFPRYDDQGMDGAADSPMDDHQGMGMGQDKGADGGHAYE